MREESVPIPGHHERSIFLNPYWVNEWLLLLFRNEELMIQEQQIQTRGFRMKITYQLLVKWGGENNGSGGTGNLYEGSAHETAKIAR